MLFKQPLNTLCMLIACALSINAYAQSTDPDDSPSVDIETPLYEDLDSDAVRSDATPLPLKKIKTFAEIFTRIKRSYVEPVSDEKLLDYAVEGMLNGLDPHSVYLKDDRLDDLNEGTTGRFGGLGMEVMMEGGFVKVIAPIDDTPAFDAGILSGDLIIRIDGKTVSGNSLQEATEQMRGEPGTPITLSIIRESKPEPFDVTLERAIVKFNSIKRKRLSDQIGYLRITQFQLTTAEDFRKQLKQLREIKDFSGLIIDLRNNPGGLLNSAVSIADVFIKEGVIVSTKGRESENDQEFLATSLDLIDGKPIIVLINGGSASASEIVAGALQDHKRAIILGTDSFGKGSVQTVMNIDEKQAIKLTTARYYTPSGASIQAAGIVPDVFVKQRQFQEDKKSFDRIKEDNLPGHLENDKAPKTQKISKDTQKLLARDYQLNEAFNLMKGLALYQKIPEDD